jgi:protein-disulfide isomerase
MKNIKKFLLIIVFMLPINTYADLNLANFIVRNHEISQMPSIGSNDAKYTIVEFFDYRCGYCAKQAADYTNILNKRNDVRIIYLEFPIFGGISEIAANIALIVWNDNSRLYLDIHNEFMKLASDV